MEKDMMGRENERQLYVSIGFLSPDILFIYGTYFAQSLI